MHSFNENKEEITLLKRSIHAFAEKEVEPYYEQWEEQGQFPRELWTKLGAAGLLCVDIPEQYGGLGAPLTYSATIIDEFSRLGFASIVANLSVHSDIVAHYLLKYGTEKQKNHYLPKMVTGEMIAAIAMTEPDAGSDLQGVKTTAIKMDEAKGFLLNGAKTFITNGQHFDFAVVVARTDKEVKASRGTSLFLVDATCNGVRKGKNLNGSFHT